MNSKPVKSLNICNTWTCADNNLDEGQICSSTGDWNVPNTSNTTVIYSQNFGCPYDWITHIQAPV